MVRSVFVPKQLRHKASGMIFNANPQLELSSDYEEYSPARVIHPESTLPVKRRGRPPKEAKDGDAK